MATINVYNLFNVLREKVQGLKILVFSAFSLNQILTEKKTLKIAKNPTLFQKKKYSTT